MHPKIPRHVYVTGVGSSPVARNAEGNLSEYVLSAVVEAVTAAGVSRDAIDGIVTSGATHNATAKHAEGVDQVTILTLVQALGIDVDQLSFAMDTQVMAGSMMAAAIQAIETGTCDCVVIAKGMYNTRDNRYSDVNRPYASGTEQFTLPYGFGPGGARFALWLNRYMYETGAGREDLYQVVKLARENAARNPLAFWRGKTVTLPEYLSARFISAPLCLYDCDIPVTGAAALVLMSETGIGRCYNPTSNRPARVVGYGMQGQLESMLSNAGISLSDIAVMQLYDGFSSMIWYWLEKLGMAERGLGYRWLQDGSGVSGCRPALNTFGGALGEGRLHGMGHIREGVVQAMGAAGERQVDTTGIGLVQVGIPESSWLFLLSGA